MQVAFNTPALALRARGGLFSLRDSRRGDWQSEAWRISGFVHWWIDGLVGWWISGSVDLWIDVLGGLWVHKYGKKIMKSVLQCLKFTSNFGSILKFKNDQIVITT